MKLVTLAASVLSLGLAVTTSMPSVAMAQTTAAASSAAALPQPPENKALLSQVFTEARTNLAELESLMRQGQYAVALTKAKASLDDVRIKSGIHPKASFREKIQLAPGTLEGTFSQIGMPFKQLSIDAQDAVALTVANHRAGYFLDILNLMKRTNLIYLQAFHKTLRKSGKLLKRDADKIREDILAVHAIPLYLKDARVGSYFLAFDFELANSDQNYLFNRELMTYLLEAGRDLGIRKESDIEQMLANSVTATRNAYIQASSGSASSGSVAYTQTTSSASSRSSNPFENSNFKACYSYYENTWTSATATDECLKKYQRFNYLTSVFKSCHSLYSATWTSASAAQKCEQVAN